MKPNSIIIIISNMAYESLEQQGAENRSSAVLLLKRDWFTL